ncbi:unnamed protein product, partial [Heterosigma akashiwo]
PPSSLWWGRGSGTKGRRGKGGAGHSAPARGRLPAALLCLHDGLDPVGALGQRLLRAQVHHEAGHRAVHLHGAGDPHPGVRRLAARGGLGEPEPGRALEHPGGHLAVRVQVEREPAGLGLVPHDGPHGEAEAGDHELRLGGLRGAGEDDGVPDGGDAAGVPPVVGQGRPHGLEARPDVHAREAVALLSHPVLTLDPLACSELPLFVGGQFRKIWSVCRGWYLPVALLLLNVCC